MVLTSDQQQVKALLTETITLLCKNGLHFQSEFSIEGLIGITLDQNNVFLVSIKETIKCDNGRNSDMTVTQTKADLSSRSSPTQLRGKRHIRTNQNVSLDRAGATHEACLPPLLSPASNAVVSDVPDVKVEAMTSDVSEHSRSVFDESLVTDEQSHTVSFSASRIPDPQDSQNESDSNNRSDVAPRSKYHETFEPASKRLCTTSTKKINDSVQSNEGAGDYEDDDAAAHGLKVCKKEPLDVVEIPDDDMDSSLNADNSYLMYMSMYGNGDGGVQSDAAYSNQYDLLPVNQHSAPGCSSWSAAQQPANLLNNQDKAASSQIAKPPHSYVRAVHVTKSVMVKAASVSSDKVTQRPNDELLHMLYHHRKYVCQLCGKRMPRERDLKAHMASRHFMAKDFCCKLCGAEYGYKYNLQQHMKIKHRTQLNEFNGS